MCATLTDTTGAPRHPKTSGNTTVRKVVNHQCYPSYLQFLPRATLKDKCCGLLAPSRDHNQLTVFHQSDSDITEPAQSQRRPTPLTAKRRQDTKQQVYFFARCRRRSTNPSASSLACVDFSSTSTIARCCVPSSASHSSKRTVTIFACARSSLLNVASSGSKRR